MAATYPSDQSFIAALWDRNISAASYFYDHYASFLFRAITCHAKNQKQAQKILENTMIYIWDHIEEFEGQDQRLLIWMSGIARKTALAHRTTPMTIKLFKLKKMNFNAASLPKWLLLADIKKTA
jgi:hypothetical protein